MFVNFNPISEKVNVEAINATTVVLNWRNIPGKISRYKISYLVKDGTAEELIVDEPRIVIRNLIPEGTYFFSVRHDCETEDHGLFEKQTITLRMLLFGYISK